MDPATLIGLAVGFGAIIVAMLLEGGNPMSILLPAPLVLVFGGTLGVGIAGGLLRDISTIVAGLKKALLGGSKPPTDTIAEIVSLAERARREGLLALEEAVGGVEDEFLRDGLQSAIDGTDPEDLRTIMLDKIDAKTAHDKVASKFFTDLGGFAPTIGIIGTVISLVHVLENLGNPDDLGHMIAAAFVATLWGVLSANVMWLPIANRLKRLTESEVAQMHLVVEGVTAIQAGANPRLVQQRLASLVPPSKAADAAAGKAAA
ncbi:flagellar motor protein [Angustibacter speluncae]